MPNSKPCPLRARRGPRPGREVPRRLLHDGARRADDPGGDRDRFAAAAARCCSPKASWSCSSCCAGRPDTISRRGGDWAIGLAGTLLPLLAVAPEGPALIPIKFAEALMIGGLHLAALGQAHARGAASASSPPIAASRRAVPTGSSGIPMYAGYALTHIGFLLAGPTLWNFAIYGATLAIAGATDPRRGTRARRRPGLSRSRRSDALPADPLRLLSGERVAFLSRPSRFPAFPGRGLLFVPLERLLAARKSQPILRRALDDRPRLRLRQRHRHPARPALRSSILAFAASPCWCRQGCATRSPRSRSGCSDRGAADRRSRSSIGVHRAVPCGAGARGASIRSITASRRWTGWPRTGSIRSTRS